MCLAHGQMFIVLILESIVLGPLLRILIFYGMKLGLPGIDLSANPEGVIESFTIALVVAVIQALVCLAMAWGLCNKRALGFVPFYIWKLISLGCLGAFLAVLFAEESLHLITGKGEAVHDENINQLDRLIFLNHATGFVFNTYGKTMSWVDFRNQVLIPPIVTGLAVGLYSLIVAIAAAVEYGRMRNPKVRSFGRTDP